jgi:hypothetical protein
MEIVLAVIFGAAVGALAHFVLGARDSRGPVLAPVLGAVVGGGVWAGLTWAGLTTANAWLWIAALAAPVIVVFVAVPVLSRVRRTQDQRRRERLNIA